MFPFSTAILMLQNKGPWVTLLTYITTIANFDCTLYICSYFSTVSLKLPFKVKYYHYLNQYFRKVIIVKKILPIVLYI